MQNFNLNTMYRTVFTPSETDSIFPFLVPREWYGRDIEFIAFPLDLSKTILRETIKKSEPAFRSMQPQYLFSTKNFKFNRDDANNYE